MPGLYESLLKMHKNKKMNKEEMTESRSEMMAEQKNPKMEMMEYKKNKKKK